MSGRGFSAIGNVMVNRAPPSVGSRSTETLPWSSATTWATIDRPSPEPGRARADGERQKRSKMNGRSASSMPGPLSPTEIMPSCESTTMRPPWGVNLIALVRRLEMARSSRSRRPSTLEALDVDVDRDLLDSRVGARGVEALIETLVQSQRLDGAFTSFAAREFAEVGHQCGEFIDLRHHVVGQLTQVVGVQLLGATQDLRVRAQRGEGSAQLVTGVDDQLTLQDLAALDGREESVEHAPESTEFVVVTFGESVTQVVRLGDGLDLVGDLLRVVEAPCARGTVRVRGRGAVRRWRRASTCGSGCAVRSPDRRCR